MEDRVRAGLVFAEQIDAYWALSDRLRALMIAGHGPGGDSGLRAVLVQIADRARAAADAVAVLEDGQNSGTSIT
jgi:hypothetical protein